MKILSADDSSTIRRIIKGVVEVLGYDFCEAENGKRAMEVLEKEYSNIDLVLLDWNMPEMNGFEVLKAIMADERFSSIPVMMVTTESELGNVAKAVSAGAKHYLTKPFSTEDLSARIMECLGMGLEI